MSRIIGSPRLKTLALAAMTRALGHHKALGL